MTAAAPVIIIALAALAVFFTRRARLKNFAFTVWVFAFVAASMFYPGAFRSWFGQDLKILIVPLIQIITFGMGTTLNLKNFERVLAMPWPWFIGIVLQFTIMPLVGFSIAMIFGFDPEIAAGVILIGCAPSGVASNVMTYLAGGNVPLSVTITSSTTLLSPLMTPLLMKTLAGRFIHVPFISMMLSILNMIIVPIAAGLIANKILYAQKKWAKKAGSLAAISAITISLAVITIFIRAEFFGPLAPLKGGIVLGLLLIGVVTLAKLLMSVLFRGPENWMDKALPVVSMVSICLIIAVITAQSRNQLLSVGLLLILASVLHNGTGYFLGYWAARLVRLEESACRAVAMEVGMQNGGLASGIAVDVLKSTSAALAPAIFGPWQNISGSILASFWRRRPVGGRPSPKS